MYDIRYPPNGLQRNPKPTSPRHTSTKPYITFPEYSPEVITPDFDISSDLGLLASGKLVIPVPTLFKFPDTILICFE